VIAGTPKYVSNLADAIEGTTRYAAFKAAHRAEKLAVETSSPRRPMVYVGANDGMLHGFDANTNEERFAFIPTATIENLYKLPAQKYTGTGHQYYVDGTPVINDVYFDDAWHTVLVGTLRAGGRSLFALDITDPENITLLWEKSFGDTDLDNLGYTFPQPVIARLHTGNWAVVIGNGYGNQAGGAADKASLMIFNIKTGALQREMVVTGDISKANGLSSVRLADNNSDGVADYAYAGDLQGNMWRFDLVTTSPTSPTATDPFKRGTGFLGNIDANTFAVSYGGTPLYTATDSRAAGTATAQAIMAPPSLVRHPSTLGYLVIFGTGKYFESNDGNVDSTRANTLYGIWDRKTKAQMTSSRTALTRANLEAQTITEQPANPFSDSIAQGIRIVSNNSVQWYNTAATTQTDSDVDRWGWALDFKVTGSTPTYSGEMMINSMAVRGQTLLLSTLTPNSNPCAGDVDSWLYGLDPVTGGRTKFNVFDLNNDKTVDDYDKISLNGSVISSYKKPGSGGFTTNNGDIFTAPSQGGGMKYSSGPNSTGRQSWRAIEAPEEVPST
jgi:type IV pilus assembly protein PilY1